MRRKRFSAIWPIEALATQQETQWPEIDQHLAVTGDLPDAVPIDARAVRGTEIAQQEAVRRQHLEYRVMTGYARAVEPGVTLGGSAQQVVALTQLESHL